MVQLSARLFAWIDRGFHPLPAGTPQPCQPLGWLGLSLLVPLYFGGVTAWYATTSGPIVQDDVRLHIVWLQRLADPLLFPHDPIAHYFGVLQSVGFQAFYRLFATVGIAPLTLAKGLPLVLALVTTGYLFHVALLLLPVPMSGVLVTLVLNQNIWLKDDLVSATPRAFIYPLFAAFLYHVLRGHGWISLLLLGAQGLFYPQMMLVSLGILTLRLIQWHGYRPVLQGRPGVQWQWASALVISLGLSLTFSRQVTQAVGPLISAEAMQTMPEFLPGGRREYFGVPLLQFLTSGASGLRLPLFPPIILLGLGLPFWRYGRCTGKPTRHRSTLAHPLTSHVQILPQLLISAVGLFLLAHALFPALYLPSRYSFYSLRFVMAIASGLVLTLISHRLWLWLTPFRTTDDGNLSLHPSRPKNSAIRAGLAMALAIAILVVPAIPPVFLDCHGWIETERPQLYEAIAHYPKDTLVASLTPEIDTVPAFSQRSVLVGAEFAMPYHREFYDMMLERMAQLVTAQYSVDAAPIRTIIQTYGLGLWIVDKAFTAPDYLEQQRWLTHSSIQTTVQAVAAEHRAYHQTGQAPVLLATMPLCTRWQDESIALLDAQCILQTLP